MLPYFGQSFIKSMSGMGARNMLESGRKRNELQEMKRLAADRYLFLGQKNQRVTGREAKGGGGGGRRHGQRTSDEGGIIRPANEKIERRGAGQRPGVRLPAAAEKRKSTKCRNHKKVAREKEKMLPWWLESELVAVCGLKY